MPRTEIVPVVVQHDGRPDELETVNFLETGLASGLKASETRDFSRRVDVDRLADAFPDLILEAIEATSLDAGRKAREARMASRTMSLSPSRIDPWRPFTRRRASSNDVSEPASRPRLKPNHTIPPDLFRNYALSRPSWRKQPSLASGNLPPPDGPSNRPSPPVAPRYRAMPPSRSPKYSLSSPLPPILEAPKDLDTVPQGSWALRQAPEKILGRSTSCPDFKTAVSKRAKGHGGTNRYSLGCIPASEKERLQQRFVSREERRIVPDSLAIPDVSVDDSDPQEAIIPSLNIAPKPVLSNLCRSPRTLALSSNPIPLSHTLPSGSGSGSGSGFGSSYQRRPLRACTGSLDAGKPRHVTVPVRAQRSRSAPTPVPAGPMCIPDCFKPPTPPVPGNRRVRTAWMEGQDVFYMPGGVPCLTPDCESPTSEYYQAPSGSASASAPESKLPQVDENQPDEKEDLASLLVQIETWAWPSPPSHLPSPPPSHPPPAQIFTPPTDADLETMHDYDHFGVGGLGGTKRWGGALVDDTVAGGALVDDTVAGGASMDDTVAGGAVDGGSTCRGGRGWWGGLWGRSA